MGPESLVDVNETMGPESLVDVNELQSVTMVTWLCCINCAMTASNAVLS